MSSEYVKVDTEEPDTEFELLNTLKRYMTIILWVSVVLFLIAIVSMARTFVLNNSVQDLNRHTDTLSVEVNDAREASIEAKEVLTNALNEFEERRISGEDVSSSAIREALVAVDRIEQHLCGGPCG